MFTSNPCINRLWVTQKQIWVCLLDQLPAYFLLYHMNIFFLISGAIFSKGYWHSTTSSFLIQVHLPKGELEWSRAQEAISNSWFSKREEGLLPTCIDFPLFPGNVPPSMKRWNKENTHHCLQTHGRQSDLLGVRTAPMTRTPNNTGQCAML